MKSYTWKCTSIEKNNLCFFGFVELSMAVSIEDMK